MDDNGHNRGSTGEIDLDLIVVNILAMFGEQWCIRPTYFLRNSRDKTQLLINVPMALVNELGVDLKVTNIFTHF